MSGSVLSVYNPWEKLVMRSPLEIQWLGLSNFPPAAWLHSLVGELRSRRLVQCSLNKQIKVNYGNTSCLAFFQGVKYGNTWRPAVVKNFKLPCFVGINERLPFFSYLHVRWIFTVIFIYNIVKNTSFEHKKIPNNLQLICIVWS